MGLSGVSPLSLILILLIIVSLFGTKKIKNMGSDIGLAIKNFRRALNTDEISEIEHKIYNPRNAANDKNLL